MKKFLSILLIAVAVFLSYAPALRDGFVWDDTALILRDPLIRSWRLIPEGFNHFLFVDATASAFYRPIQRLTYTLEYAAFALRPMPYHLTSIICHAAAAVAFLFSILSKETGLIIFLLATSAPVLRRNWGATLKTAGAVVFASVVYLSLRLPAEHFAPPVLRAPPPPLVNPILLARAFAE